MFRQRLDDFIEGYQKEHSLSGVLRVTFGDEVIYQRFMGKADYERNISFDDRSLFTFYSLSKPFCAMGLLKLWDKGLVDIDGHPGSYVPEAQWFDKRVTIRHLLHHVSGLPDFVRSGFAEGNRPGTPDRIREHLRLLREYPMFFEPGTGTLYSNINFIICALIIENVSGLQYADYMKTEVFEPLGVRTAMVDHEGLKVCGRVQGYEMNGEDVVPVEKAYDWLLGAGDIIGTVDDVYCLNRAIKYRLLLAPDTWDMVLSASPINSFGMGCTVTEWHGRKRITHNGGHPGFRTLHIQLLEDDLDIILLSNNGAYDPRPDLSEAVYTAYYGTHTEAGGQPDMDNGYI